MQLVAGFRVPPPFAVPGLELTSLGASAKAGASGHGQGKRGTAPQGPVSSPPRQAKLSEGVACRAKPALRDPPR